MANANMTPMPFVRKFGSASTTASTDRSSPTSRDDDSGKQSLSALAQSAFPSRYDPNAFVDISGAAISAPTVTGACKRCGYPGHLYFQCRNHIQVKPNQSTKAYEVSSTSSESSADETPLVALEKEKERKKLKKLRKKERKERKQEKKAKKKLARKEAKKRRRDSSSESDSDSDDDHKRRKRSKKSKKEKRKRRHSSSSDSDSDTDYERHDSKRRRRS
ncbi:Protein CBG19106 [Caenorhabditis briggsae]|uniref:CCHC-type domain-containing protein n=2 Tax=Caenorhabditis briggsae TaxID=6238 RepID=A0AAE9JLR7_CAEBR|nr:Protein CBG19106 [Caenorhabditis briggsae]ULT90517.1 hypothetical protein L3Y34_008682 [Caenorhabditis briggsae]UMM36302.1 hypothetical protein L5515_008522 [Caenorhabditis briggsae]CAP36407.1 Protein CBG19106 [Caenorhabditis briggsae]